jgi:hypothetical protein
MHACGYGSSLFCILRTAFGSTNYEFIGLLMLQRNGRADVLVFSPSLLTVPILRFSTIVACKADPKLVTFDAGVTDEKFNDYSGEPGRVHGYVYFRANSLHVGRAHNSWSYHSITDNIEDGVA